MTSTICEVLNSLCFTPSCCQLAVFVHNKWESRDKWIKHGNIFLFSISHTSLSDPCVSQSTPTCLKDVLEQLLDAVVTYSEPSGRLISELFQKLPSKMVWESSASLLVLSFSDNSDASLTCRSISFSNIPIITPLLRSPLIWKSSLKGFRCVSFFSNLTFKSGFSYAHKCVDFRLATTRASMPWLRT